MRAGTATQTSGGRGPTLGPGGAGSPAEGDPRPLSSKPACARFSS